MKRKWQVAPRSWRGKRGGWQKSAIQTRLNRQSSRRGFTLTEIMIAVTISVFVFAAMGMVLSKCFSLWKDASAHWKLAQYARISRERILHGGFANPAGGLLSATNVSIVETSFALNVGYATESNFYGVCAYTNIIYPRLYLLDQKTIAPYWSGGYDDWRWGMRMDKSGTIPDVQVTHMIASNQNHLVTIAYRLQFSAGGKIFTQPQTIRAYLINEE